MATVQAPSVWPAGSTVSIAGAVISGDGHLVGAIPGVQFGTPTLKAPIGVSGVPSAQAFGVVTRITGGVISSSSGVPSAQAFGSPSFKTVVTAAVGGVGSAQAFGALKTASTQHPPGVPSAQAFGAVTTRTGFTKPVGGVGSAQLFGVPTPVWKQAFQLAGVTSAQSFGALTIKGSVKPQAGGVPSAQAFGAIFLVYRQSVVVSGVPSAQAFGTALVAYVDWLHELHCIGTPDQAICGEVICGDGSVCGGYGFLADLAEDDLDLDALVCLEASDPLCGQVICGDGTVCGGHRYITPTSPPTLDLEESGSQELVLAPLACV